MTMLPYFLEKMRSTPDGDGNLLDHSLVLCGSPMGDGNVHGHKRVPVLLLGKASGAVQGNLHVQCDGRDAVCQRAADDAAQAWRGRPTDRRQHRRGGDMTRWLAA